MKIAYIIAVLLIVAGGFSTPAYTASVTLGQVTADAMSSTVTAIIQPDAADVGKTANVWIVAIYGGSVYLHNGANWVSYGGGPIPSAMKNVTLTASLTVTAIDHIPNSMLAGLAGLQLYVGFGANEQDMMTSPGKLAKIYTVNTPALATADLAEIQAQITAFQNLFATALPSASAVQGFFAPSFLHNGNDGPTAATSWTKAPAAGQGKLVFPPGVQLTAKPAGALDPGQSNSPGSVAWVGVRVAYSGYSGDRDSLRFKMMKDTATGKWLIAGNQRAAKARIHSKARLQLPQMVADTGLHFDVPGKLQGANGASPQVVVTGPGLPASGVTMARKAPDGSLVQQDSGFGFVPSCASPTAAGLSACVNLLDPDLADGAVYTFTFNDPATTVYRDVLHKAPLPTASVTPGMFVPITSVSPAAIPSGLAAGTSATVNFTVPAGLMPYSAYALLATQNVPVAPASPATTYIVSSYTPSASASAVSFFLDPKTFPTGNIVKSGFIQVEAVDMYGRLFGTYQNF